MSIFVLLMGGARIRRVGELVHLASEREAAI
jgi:hypothetical protein